MIDAKLEAILKDAGLGSDAVWAHKQSGKHIMYHWACEVAAAKKGIRFDQPTVICADAANKLAVIVVTGHMGDKSEWAFGEAAPYNTTQTYPFSMCEKRGKDRVVLKLIGLHGLVYSEEEADSFKEEPKPEPKANGKFHGPLGITELKAKMRAFAGDLRECVTQGDIDMLTALLNSSAPFLEQCKADLPSWWSGDENQPGAAATIKDARETLAGQSRV